MGNITTIDFYKYPDGDTLEVFEHGRNVYTPGPMTSSGDVSVSPVDGARGLYSEINGNLDRTNFRAGDHEDVKIRKEHIRRGETHITAQESAIETLDYWDMAFGKTDTGDLSAGGGTTPDNSYVPISGCSVRVYLPYDCALVVWQWSLFYDVARNQGTSKDKDGDLAIEPHPAMFHKTFIDGHDINHTLRSFPTTWYYVSDAAAYDTIPADTTNWYNTEGRNARHMDMHHTQVNVAKGWHELQARIFLAKNDGPAVDIKTITAREGRKATETGRANRTFLHSRLTAGIRNARVMAMMHQPGMTGLTSIDVT